MNFHTIGDKLRAAQEIRQALDPLFGPVLREPDAPHFKEGIVVNGPACQQLLEAMKRYDEVAKD